MSNGQSNGVQLRLEYVGMLFALAIAQIAMQAADLVNQPPSRDNRIAAWAHLALALVVVSTSWVGWMCSKSAGNQAPLTNVFTAPFVVLLVDMLIVVVYYVIVKGAEQDVTRVSAENESTWIPVVFGLYVAWDWVTKSWITGPPASPRGFFPDGLPSLICFLVAVLVWWTCCAVESLCGVLWVDAALLILVLAFRAAKQFLTREMG